VAPEPCCCIYIYIYIYIWVISLSAIALSIKPGGSAREIDISGGVKTNGAGVAPIEQHGSIETFRVNGGFIAAGGGFDGI
jgi:hypothetical protein